MKTIQDELREWMRPVSPLTAFAKSIKNEGGVATDDPSKAAKGEYVDPFVDFDFDELPKDQKERLEKIRNEHKATHDKNAELEDRRQKAEVFARGQQARADKLATVVQRHNLPADGNPAPTHTNSADAKVAAYEELFLKDGLPEVQAKAYAKMFAKANELERASLMRDLAPLAGSVGSIQAQQALDTGRSEFKQVFDIPELAKQITDNVAILVRQGDVVNEKTIEHLTSMAWGNYALHNPDKVGKGKTDVNDDLPQLRSSLPSGGGHVSRANEPTGDAPKATQPETLTIMNNINKFMNEGLPSATKKAGK